MLLYKTAKPKTKKMLKTNTVNAHLRKALRHCVPDQRHVVAYSSKTLLYSERKKVT